VWFQTEKSCSKALAHSEYLPYPVQLYKSFCIRACEPLSQTDGRSSVTISGYPKDFTEEKLTELLGAYAIKKINFTKMKSEVTFKNPQWVEKMMVLNDVPVGGNKLVVKPITSSAD
jgi:hypothetical protein